MRSQVLEKPSSKEDQARMLDLMAGKECEVITGVTIGEFRQDHSLISLSMCRCSRIQAGVYVLLDAV
jgi:septum formation protein